MTRLALFIIHVAHGRLWRLVPYRLYLWAGDVWFRDYTRDVR